MILDPAAPGALARARHDLTGAPSSLAVRSASAGRTESDMSLDTIEEGYGYWTIYTRPRWWPLMPGPLHEDLESAAAPPHRPST